MQAGTLNVLVNLANADGDTPGQIIVDLGATLALGTDFVAGGGSGSITGGTVTINGTLELQGNNFLSNGTLQNNGQVNVGGTGNALDNEKVTNDGAIDITGALTLDNGTAITNGASNAEKVESGASLTLQNTSSISGGKLTNAGRLHRGLLGRDA